MCGQNAPPGYAGSRSSTLATGPSGSRGRRRARRGGWSWRAGAGGAECCRSDWAAMEVSVWDRGLSEEELRAVSAYYGSILRGEAVQGGVYRCARCGAGEFSTGLAE
jgi:hypothetical protein